jgi:DNA-directed RNA polymerase specialized sigma24 family protein
MTPSSPPPPKEPPPPRGNAVPPIALSSRRSDGQQRADRAEEAFGDFVSSVEPPLRRALVANLGPERGREATAEALGWAWTTWPRASRLDKPIAYLFRVGQSRTRSRKLRVVADRPSEQEPWYEPRLASGLHQLTSRQRTVVVLVHGFDWTLREVAELLGIRVTSAQNHLERGLAQLRHYLEVEDK